VGDWAQINAKQAILRSRQTSRIAAQEDPALHHAHMAVAADHGTIFYRGTRLASEINQWRLLHYTKALSLVRQKVIKLLEEGGIPSLNLVNIVFNLSFVSREWDFRVWPKTYALSPMAKAPTFASKIRKLPPDAHIKPLKMLVAARGGLDKLGSPGVAEKIWASDLNMSATELRRPNFAFLAERQILLDQYIAAKTEPDAGASKPHHQLGNAFLPFSTKDTIGLLRDIMLCSAAIARDLYELAPGYESSPWFLHIVKVGIANHHRLLSILPIGGDGPLPVAERRIESDQFYIVSLAAALFHDMVIYLVAGTAEVDLKLTALLQTYFKKARSAASTPSTDDFGDFRGLTLWALLLGCIAAPQAASHSWFVQELWQQSGDLSIMTFEQLKTFVMQYLWYENMNQPAQQAWEEASRLGGDAGSDDHSAPLSTAPPSEGFPPSLRVRQDIYYS
jgi:hypothetical protein